MSLQYPITISLEILIAAFLLMKKNRNTRRGSASCFNCIVQSIRPTYKAITFHYIAGHTREKTSSDDLTIHANNQSIGKTNVIYGVIIKGTSILIFLSHRIYKKIYITYNVYTKYI